MLLGRRAVAMRQWRVKMQRGGEGRRIESSLYAKRRRRRKDNEKGNNKNLKE